MALHRLFVGLRPPSEIRTTLLGLMAGVPGARWQDEEQLHCTLRFIGEVDRHRATDIAAALGTIRHGPIEARLSGVGAFDRKGRIEALWVGLAPREPLKHLHDKVERALALAGVMPEMRAYRPHITIARFSRRSGPPLGAEAAIRPPPPLPVRFAEMLLYESTLGEEGARYTVASSYPLRG